MGEVSEQHFSYGYWEIGHASKIVAFFKASFKWTQSLNVFFHIVEGAVVRKPSVL
jgi:hypothetical protein